MISALAPIRVPVVCRGERHQLAWQDGDLSAPAHPEPDRERALTALGGAPATCLQLLDAWQRHRGDLDVLALASRGPADPLAPAAAGNDTDDDRPPSHQHGPSFAWSAYAPMPSRAYGSGPSVHRSDNPPGTDGLRRLLTLGGGLPERLVADVATNWSDRLADADPATTAARPALEAALYGRARAALQTWLGRPTRVELTMLPPSAPPTLTWDGAAVRVELPFRWLADVWVNGFAVVLDRFCLSATKTERAWLLTTIDRDLATAATTINTA